MVGEKYAGGPDILVGSIAYSTHNADMAEQQISLNMLARKQIMQTALTIAVIYTITDSGIESGETVGDIIGFKFVGTLKEQFGGNQVVMDVPKTEMETYLLPAMARGDEIDFIDGDPTTQEEERFCAVLPWSVHWGIFEEIALYVNLSDPSAEWAGASAFECKINIYVTPGVISHTEWYTRVNKGSDTEHEIKLPPFAITGIDLVAGTSDYFSDAKLNDKGGNPAVDLRSRDDFVRPNRNRYEAINSSSPSDDIDYMRIDNVVVDHYTGRVLDVGMSTAATLKGYIRSCLATHKIESSTSLKEIFEGNVGTRSRSTNPSSHLFRSLEDTMVAGNSGLISTI